MLKEFAKKHCREKLRVLEEFAEKECWEKLKLPREVDEKHCLQKVTMLTNVSIWSIEAMTHRL